MKDLPSAVSRLFTKKKSEAAHIALGKKGEKIAAQFLSHLGYRILGRNIRLGRDEIDILAFDPEDASLVFAEVKTRIQSDRDFPAEMNAGFRKCEKLKRSARKWVATHDYDGGYRIDLLCVEGGRVAEHLKELSW